MIKKIISGGQTGADRAALDFAIYHDIPHGGWCPKERLAEDGVIDRRYQLCETSTKQYPQRTEKNVQEADGTVIFTLRPHLERGSRKTAEFAEKLHKPLLHLNKSIYSPERALLRFLEEHRIAILNVAGSRASKEPEIGRFVKDTLEDAFYPRPAGWIGGPDEG